MGNTPFFDTMARLRKLRARFFVPGHKGNPAAIPPFADVLPWDMTEVEGADDLAHPSGPLAQSEANMARAYGSGATLYCAAGTSLCIMAMLTLYLKPGGTLLAARGCHGSALRALALLDGRPCWLPLTEGQLAPATLQKALEAHPGAPVYITSPDYYGNMPDIAALAALCHAAGSPLLVDNAHGAYLHFLSPVRHPLDLGADAAADSAHKTLPCLTGASLLHLRDGALAGRARQALNLYASTSPSYLVLESMDLCAGLLLDAPPDFDAAAARLAAVARGAAHMVRPAGDPLKLCLLPAAGGWPADTVQAALEAAGILPEYSDGTHIVLMASPYNTEADFALLESVLAAFPPKPPLAYHTPALLMPEKVLELRAAYFAEKETLPVGSAVGRVAAGIDAPCPPGVPLVAPGERIGPAEANALAAGGISLLDVVK